MFNKLVEYIRQRQKKILKQKDRVKAIEKMEKELCKELEKSNHIKYTDEKN